jgi:hypothetical protein
VPLHYSIRHKKSVTQAESHEFFTVVVLYLKNKSTDGVSVTQFGTEVPANEDNIPQNMAFGVSCKCP